MEVHNEQLRRAKDPNVGSGRNASSSNRFSAGVPSLPEQTNALRKAWLMFLQRKFFMHS